MKGVNRVILLGHLGRDPEINYTQGGTAVCKFSLAVNEERKQGDQWVEHVEWLNIVIFGKNAENAAKYLSKGSGCFIEGRIQTRKWQDKDGKDRYTTEIIGDSLRFVGGGKGAPDTAPEFEPDDSDPPF